MTALLSKGLLANIIAKLACALSEVPHLKLVHDKYFMRGFFGGFQQIMLFTFKNKAVHSEKVLQVEYLGFHSDWINKPHLT